VPFSEPYVISSITFKRCTSIWYSAEV